MTHFSSEENENLEQNSITEKNYKISDKLGRSKSDFNQKNVIKVHKSAYIPKSFSNNSALFSKLNEIQTDIQFISKQQIYSKISELEANIKDIEAKKDEEIEKLKMKLTMMEDTLKKIQTENEALKEMTNDLQLKTAATENSQYLRKSISLKPQMQKTKTNSSLDIRLQKEEGKGENTGRGTTEKKPPSMGRPRPSSSGVGVRMQHSSESSTEFVRNNGRKETKDNSPNNLKIPLMYSHDKAIMDKLVRLPNCSLSMIKSFSGSRIKLLIKKNEGMFLFRLTDPNENCFDEHLTIDMMFQISKLMDFKHILPDFFNFENLENGEFLLTIANFVGLNSSSKNLEIYPNFTPIWKSVLVKILGKEYPANIFHLRQNLFLFSIDALELSIFFVLDNKALFDKMFYYEEAKFQEDNTSKTYKFLLPRENSTPQLERNIKKIGEIISRLANRLKIPIESLKEYNGLARFAADERIFLNMSKISHQKVEFQAQGTWTINSPNGQIFPSGSFILWASEFANFLGLKTFQLKREDMSSFIFHALSSFTLKDPESAKDNCLIFSESFNQIFQRYFLKDNSILTLSLKWVEKLIGLHIHFYNRTKGDEKSFFFASSFLTQSYIASKFKDSDKILNENDDFINFVQEKVFPSIKTQIFIYENKISFENEFDNYCSLDNILQKL